MTIWAKGFLERATTTQIRRADLSEMTLPFRFIPAIELSVLCQQSKPHKRKRLSPLGNTKSLRIKHSPFRARTCILCRVLLESAWDDWVPIPVFAAAAVCGCRLC